QPSPADFGARVREPVHRKLGMTIRRRAHLGDDAHPIPHRGNFTEWHTGLHHAVWTGIHPEKQHPLARGPELTDVSFVSGPRVIQWIVDVRHRRREAKTVDGTR